MHLLISAFAPWIHRPISSRFDQQKEKVEIVSSLKKYAFIWTAEESLLVERLQELTLTTYLKIRVRTHPWAQNPEETWI